jgi:hypothetical protein
MTDKKSKRLMPNEQQSAKVWSGRMLACISPAFSLSALLIFGSAIVLVQLSLIQPPTGDPSVRSPLKVITAAAWLLGGLGSVVFALTGLAFDSRRGAALAALIIAILVFFICATQMIV